MINLEQFTITQLLHLQTINEPLVVILSILSLLLLVVAIVASCAEEKIYWSPIVLSVILVCGAFLTPVDESIDFELNKKDIAKYKVNQSINNNIRIVYFRRH